MAVVTPHEHRVRAREHRAAARAAQNPNEKAAHYAAARVHELAARDPVLADAAHQASSEAESETQLVRRFGRILRGHLRGPGRRRRSRVVKPGR